MKKIFILFITLISIYSQSLSYEQYIWTTNNDYLETNSSDLKSNDENNNILNLESGSAILIEQNTGQILYSHNIHEKLRPASVTKIMSVLLIMEQIDSGKLSYSDSISCSETATAMGGSQIWLDTNETLTVDEMLKAICIVSANDCVVAMAEHIAGSEQAFVQMMNDKAKELGMNDTTFKNCHGIDEDGHLTSAYDIAIMSKELLTKHPDIKKYTTTWMDSLRNGKSELVNTNKLIRSYKGITGLKTGSTSLALYNLSASATRDDLSLIAVIMKAPSTKIRFSEATKLLDYGFSKFTYKKLATSNDIIQNVSINKGTKKSINAIIKQDTGAIIEKGQESRINQSIKINDNIQLPISKGDVIGQLTISLDDKTLNTIDLISDLDVDKINLFNMTKKTIYSWINLLR
jgi:D-alanyl-D-alanine carboxypeptidase (penicillin-binding protein 5/6)